MPRLLNDTTLHIWLDMRTAILSIRDRMDRAGILLSGLCALHCLAGIVLVSVLGLGGELLLSPAIHEAGLALAIAVGIITIGLGAARHGRLFPLALGASGIALMGAGLFIGHSVAEAMLTIAGVALVAAAHVGNIRQATC